MTLLQPSNCQIVEQDKKHSHIGGPSNMTEAALQAQVSNSIDTLHDTLKAHFDADKANISQGLLNHLEQLIQQTKTLKDDILGLSAPERRQRISKDLHVQRRKFAEELEAIAKQVEKDRQVSRAVSAQLAETKNEIQVLKNRIALAKKTRHAPRGNESKKSEESLIAYLRKSYKACTILTQSSSTSNEEELLASAQPIRGILPKLLTPRNSQGPASNNSRGNSTLPRMSAPLQQIQNTLKELNPQHMEGIKHDYVPVRQSIQRRESESGLNRLSKAIENLQKAGQSKFGPGVPALDLTKVNQAKNQNSASQFQPTNSQIRRVSTINASQMRLLTALENIGAFPTTLLEQIMIKCAEQTSLSSQGGMLVHRVVFDGFSVDSFVSKLFEDNQFLQEISKVVKAMADY